MLFWNSCHFKIAVNTIIPNIESQNLLFGAESGISAWRWAPLLGPGDMWLMCFNILHGVRCQCPHLERTQQFTWSLMKSELWVTARSLSLSTRRENMYVGCEGGGASSEFHPHPLKIEKYWSLVSHKYGNTMLYFMNHQIFQRVMECKRQQNIKWHKLFDYIRLIIVQLESQT